MTEIYQTETEQGHQFHISVCIQPQYRVENGPLIDAEVPVEYEPFTITVRAWNLAEACAKAAQLPLRAWQHSGEEQQ